MNPKEIDIIIPSFNGKTLLTKHLSATIKHSPGIGKIIVIDDGSTDGTAAFLREKYPEVICLTNTKNIGFTKSVNIGAQYSKADYLVLLNNDVEPHHGYSESALKFFSDPHMFSVSFNETNSSWPEVFWDHGKIGFTRGKDKSSPHFSAWSSGGSAIFKRSIWNQLGGFNEIYSPGYWEDIDLGWRAWKNGYKIVWDPHSEVVHQHESTFSKLNSNYVNLIKQRNEIIFNYLNISSPLLRKSYLSFLATHSIKHPGYLRVVLAMLPKLHHNRVIYTSTITDEQVLSQVNSLVQQTSLPNMLGYRPKN